MAITHYIDSTAPEIARARIKSTTNRVPESFPVLVYGDTRNHNFIFFNAQTGAVESFSGSASYSLRVTIGETEQGPTSGTYTLTCGANTTGLISAKSDADTIEQALNALAQVVTDGGVVVTGTFPNFLVTWKAVGVVTGLTSSAALLRPSSTVSLVTTQTGSATVANQVAIVLRQAAITSQTSWTIIASPAAGWTGTLTTNTAAALILLSTEGQQVGEFVEVGTCLTAEVLDSSGVPISYYQTPIVLRAKNLDPSNTASPALTSYNLGDMLYGDANYTLARLAGTTNLTRRFLTQAGDGTNSAQPNWVTISDSDLPASQQPQGPNTAVQINIASNFYGDANFTYDPATGVVAALRYAGTWTSQVNASNANTGTLPDAQFGFGTNVLPWCRTPSSDNLRFAVTDETGTGGGLVFATAPNLTTPNIGAASGLSATLANLTTGYLTVASAGGLLINSDLTCVTTATVTAVTTLTGNSLTLATLDNNSNINLSPHGTGWIAADDMRLPSTATAGLSWYNTVDQTTNYERFRIFYSGNAMLIQQTFEGSGTSARSISLTTYSATGGVGSNNFVIAPTGTRFAFNTPATSATADFITFSSSAMNPSSGTTNYVSIKPTYNASSTHGAADLTVLATETGLGSGTQLHARFGSAGTPDRFSFYRSGNFTCIGSITTGAPNGGTAGAWKLGINVAAVSALDTGNYVQLDIGGVAYKLALVT